MVILYLNMFSTPQYCITNLLFSFLFLLLFNTCQKQMNEEKENFITFQKSTTFYFTLAQNMFFVWSCLSKRNESEDSLISDNTTWESKNLKCIFLFFFPLTFLKLRVFVTFMIFITIQFFKRQIYLKKFDLSAMFYLIN